MADKKDKKDEDAEDKDASDEGGEEGAEGGAEGASGKKSSKKRKIIIIAAAAVVLIAGTGAGLYFSGVLTAPAKVEVSGKKSKKKKSDEAERGTTGSSVKSVKSNPNEWVPGVIPGHEGDDVVYYNLPEFLVNLNTGGKQTSFIKMKITLEAPSDSDADAIDSRMPRITDSFNTYLRELRTSDLSGSAGLYRLREELLLRVNKTIYPSKVNDILFREIILQ
jgi:flagellar FliL protein